MLFLLLLLIKLIFLRSWFVDVTMEETKEASTKIKETISQTLEGFTETRDIEHLLEKIEEIAALVDERQKEGTLITTDAEVKYDEVVETLEDLINLLKIPENTNKLLNITGIDRTITLILGTNYERLKKQGLIAIKTLFNVSPTVASTVLPMTIVDKLLDIFEYDTNLAIKTHALDILFVWLPNNPRVQARVMKLKGLEPFYDQVSKLDASVIYTLLDLFSRILEEHVAARNNASLMKDKREIYRQIGLIERMSTTAVCNGLLNIFELILPFKENDDEFLKVIFNLTKNIKPFCLQYYNYKYRPTKIFTSLKSYFTDPDKTYLLVKLGLNLTEVKTILEDYTNNKKINGDSRDEF